MIEPIIIYLVIFLIVVVLIFKLIKKVIFAMITVFVLVLLIFAGVGAMVYYDYKDLTSANQLYIDVMYGNYNTANFGVEFLIENKTLVNELKFVPMTDEIRKKIKDDKKTDRLYVFINKSYYKDLMNNQDEYAILGLGDQYQLLGKTINLKVSKNELFNLLDATDSLSEYVNFIAKANHLESISKYIGGNKAIEEKFKEGLKTHKFNELVLGTVLSNFDKKESAILLLKGFKNGEIEIYPEKFSFKLIKYLPIDLATSLVESNLNKSSTSS